VRRTLIAAVVAFSLVVCAWFALSARQALLTDRATALIAPGASPRQLARAEGLLNSASVLNPDRSLQILRAEAELFAGHAVRARAILKRVVAAEPDDLLAWEWLARASVGDPHEFYLAAFRIEQLVPPLPRRR
jgi:hypothetical protein